MRTLEEVRKHLSEVVYNDMEDRRFIVGFLMGQGIWENWDKPMDFAEYEEHDLTDFFAWWDKAEEEEEARKKLIQFNEENKEIKKKCISEMDAALKELEEKANCTTDPKLQKVASCFLEFAKELRKEVKKQINA